jgi:NadR type nicotinamide-nucleotide adenylyltransferase
MPDKDQVKWIIISGPESTGKTELAKNLATRLNTLWVPEYAREYIENLNRPYSYDDIEHIARHQLAQERIYVAKLSSGLLIFDTWFIITKVWFDVVFGHCPDWIITHIQSTRIDLFLVCSNDLPWIPDLVRENGGKKREQLFQIYCNEISSFGFKYEIIKGTGSMRVENAITALAIHGLMK